MSRADARIPGALSWGKHPFLRKKIAILHFTDENATRQSLRLAGTQLDPPSLTPKSRGWEATCQGITRAFPPRVTHQLEGFCGFLGDEHAAGACSGRSQPSWGCSGLVHPSCETKPRDFPLQLQAPRPAKRKRDGF